MIQIEDMQLAAALLREPSLSAAARALDVTPPALSMRLRKLEATLGLSLASRTARRLSLTSEGERFAREAAALLGQIEGLRESMQRDDKRLTGTLRIAAPFGYGRQYVAPMLARFARLHPGLRVQLDLRETPWPDRHDADAVIHIGAVRDSSWVARTLSANERWLCASPAYLRRHGEPRTPRDVLTHACICIRENDEDVTLWHVRPAADAANAAEGKRAAARETLRVSPAYVTNDGGVARQWAEQGMGLVLRSEWDAADAVARGTLVRVLPGWRFDSAPVTLLVPTRKGRTARVAAIVDFLVESFGSGAR
ncbi:MULTISPECIES: LysR family transcriptional regulator [Variovorax]|jgi:DNA-binding transcriptional LysR family regulator|uniref:LysR family transcriptional regulator n=1 Tax=Variovorax TaxID=34072 RepID=UPI00086F509E|nr:MULTISPECIES: LysR family transcriptional regulator [Variovorax]MBN8751881.1 LysR family transcriptional regulator [Variovorax sp.]ODU17700.1 MAG: LysR family transcriptional regulator [Variovorax sp. SCN 67-85]ODV27057.1 MAG: LysR family transcriptional regulator [Variovorax sp. SCN 67-20]OJZ09289.1 MAG: LysR family transcriptional regulator [Variovorax sp. 67-131]UKI04863.1 LysR family transcriptional regulator [Variovorax paradoxus]